MAQLPAFALAFLAGLMLIAVVTDVLYFKVHNLLTIPLIVSGAVYHTVQTGLPGLLHSLAAIVVAFGMLIIPFLLGGLGAGDIKLLAGVGAWTLFPDTIWIFCIAGLLAGLGGLLLSLLKHGSISETLAEVWILICRIRDIGNEVDGDAWARRQFSAGQKRLNLIPFALLIAAAMGIRFFIIC
ncbi:MAG: hypothetical protein RLZZ436_18 [Planctomycetota bacterium]|jgi:prepilin peptidase CpaA